MRVSASPDVMRKMDSGTYGRECSALSVYERIGNLDIIPDTAYNLSWQAPANYIDELLTALDKRVLGSTVDQLPATVEELAELGVAAAVLKELRSLADAGHAEHDIVRAYLEALVLRAIQLGASRQLIRALRNQFQNPEDCKDLRAVVAAMVGETPTVDSVSIDI